MSVTSDAALSEHFEGAAPADHAPVVSVAGLGKRFRLYNTPSDRIVEWLCFSRTARHRELWALRDVSFNIRRGECLGIVGNNGAGKSSLLKILSGTQRPTTGTIDVRGRVLALLELGTGFRMELSGSANIHLVGSLLNIAPEYIRQRYDDIVAFSGLDSFIDVPIKTYSSGMLMRLAFSLYAFLEPDILIVDEAMAVGDVPFQLKCFRRMEELIYDENRTVIVVSHDTNALARFCDRVIWLDKGRIRMDGDASDVISAYIMANSQALVEHRKEEEDRPLEPTAAQIHCLPTSEAAVLYLSDEAEVVGLWVEDAQGCSVSSVDADEPFTLCYRVRFHVAIDGPVFGMRIVTRRGELVVSTNTHLADCSVPQFCPGDETLLRWRLRPGLLPGDYFISCGVSRPENHHDFLVRHLDAYHFVLRGTSRAGGVISVAAAPTMAVFRSV